MSSNKQSYQLTIEYLESLIKDLSSKISLDSDNREENITLKSNVFQAIKMLKICSHYQLNPQKLNITEIPEQGSESFFTTFHLIDEADSDMLSDEKLIKDKENNVIEVSCFDLILTKE